MTYQSQQPPGEIHHCDLPTSIMCVSHIQQERTEWEPEDRFRHLSSEEA
jgi:hypothetical protein